MNTIFYKFYYTFKMRLPLEYYIMSSYEKNDSYSTNVAKSVISQFDLKNRTRSQEVLMKRQYVMWFLRENTNLPLQKIGDLFGGFNHATIIWAINATQNSLKVKDKVFSYHTEEVKKMINQFINK